jgi:organic hydroperoxide reductase OsmC/OhrA
MAKEHRYKLAVRWTGNQGTGTSTYTAYSRNHEVLAAGKAAIAGSSDPAFRGDRSRYNPEELLVASVSTCHMLWYLHLCADRGVVVTSYEDTPLGVMREDSDGSGAFTEVVLRPVVTISQGSESDAHRLHEQANRMCYIANSVKFPVRHEAIVKVAE